jgi:hypothetical protein
MLAMGGCGAPYTFSRNGESTVMPVAEIIRRAGRLISIDRDRHALDDVNNVNAEGKTNNMSSKFLAPALAAPLALAAIAPGPVLAWNAGSHHHAHPYQYHHAYGYNLHQPFPHGARGSYTGPQIFAPPSARPFQTDPDPNVRFELNRDDNRSRN